VPLVVKAISHQSIDQEFLRFYIQFKEAQYGTGQLDAAGDDYPICRKNNFPCDTVCYPKDKVCCALWIEGDQLTFS
jgi:hypothetical protein